MLAVRELDKACGEDCEHLDRDKRDGCTIYATRPLVCQQYRCAWLTDAGFGDTWHRPDRLGVLFTVRDVNPDVGSFSGSVLVAHETRPGAFDEPGAKKFMKHVAGRFVVLCFGGPILDRTFAMGPADQLAAITAWCSERGVDMTGILKCSA